MKESSWENSTEDSSEFFDSEALLNDSDAIDQVAPESTKVNRVTELRRAMEMRLDSKRITSEVDYLQDDSSDSLQ